MKPFDLEAAKRGEPLITRDGHQAWFVGVAPKEAGAALHQLAVWVDGEFTAYTLDGKFARPYSEESDLDLFMAPRTFTHWLNVWSEFGNIKSALFDNEIDAHQHTNELRYDEHTVLVAGRPIEWTA